MIALDPPMCLQGQRELQSSPISKTWSHLPVVRIVENDMKIRCCLCSGLKIREPSALRTYCTAQLQHTHRSSFFLRQCAEPFRAFRLPMNHADMFEEEIVTWDIHRTLLSSETDDHLPSRFHCHRSWIQSNPDSENTQLKSPWVPNADRDLGAWLPGLLDRNRQSVLASHFPFDQITG
jgi:hypothetical protein